ncbi:MAG: MBL fold metallo-hydrolase [Bacteroidales bacterium]|nr:MBL fold metallo-hydrolase [Bacteroidales bacterium]
MIDIQTFVFNPFQENTYLVSDSSLKCIVIDPGCHFEAERQQLVSYINNKQLQPQVIVHTHGHIDHVMGINFLKEYYHIQAIMHPADLKVLRSSKDFAGMVGLEIDQPSDPEQHTGDNETLEFGESRFQILHVPGHSPGSIALYNHQEGIVFSGDVLFRRGMGRTDLMGGNYNTLVESIQNKLFTLPDETIVYPGHGETTTIGEEKRQNPVLP